MRKTLVVFAMIAALLVVAGCAPRSTPFGGASATDKDVNAIDGDVSDVSALGDDLDTSDLDSLEQELSDIDSLEVQ
ncbi:MAG: hypothetical protein QXM31_01825 [Candidatus Woesearchaeota archaeon]